MFPSPFLPPPHVSETVSSRLICIVSSFHLFRVLVTDTPLDPMTPDFEFLDYVLRDCLHVVSNISMYTLLLHSLV